MKYFLPRYTVVMELIPDEAGQLNCVETWPRLPQLAYGSFINIMQFVIPFATMFVCYTRSHEHGTACSRDRNEGLRKISQSRRRPLLTFQTLC